MEVKIKKVIKTLVCKRQEKNYMVKVRKTLNLHCGLCLPLLALGIITQESQMMTMQPIGAFKNLS